MSQESVKVYTVPQAVRRCFVAGTVLQKVVANTSWVMSEHVCRLAVGLFVSILVARYLGPQSFGILSYSLSITAFLSIFASLGLSGIVVRDIVKHPEEAGLLMGSSFALRVSGACISYVVILGLAIGGHSSGTELWVLVIVGASLFFRPVDTIDLWFQSKIESKYTVFGKSGAFLIASIGNVVIALVGAPVIAFAAIGLAESVLVAILLMGIYSYKGQTIRSWKVQTRKMIGLLGQSWVLILSSFFALVYLKVDQVMLRWMVGTAEVGIYSVAARFSEVWYFVPSAIVVSLFPRLLEVRQTDRERYERRLQQGFDVLFVLSLLIAVVMTFIGPVTIRYLYGHEYERAGYMLCIHVWAGVFVFMRALFSKWIVAEDLLVFSLLSHGLGAVMNVLLNLLLIRSHGGYGAAVATLISYATASYLVLFLSPKTWPIAKMMSKSIALPVRILIHRDRVWV